MKEKRKKDEVIDAVVKNSLGFLAIFAGIIFPILTFAVLLFEALPAIKAFGVIGFLKGTTWDPVRDIFGGLPAIVGTLITTFIASIIALPVSIGIAIFIVELSPKFLKPVISTSVDLLGAIPSIIYGMWGLFVLAPFMSNYVEPFLQSITEPIPILRNLFAGAPTGIDALTAGVILSIMIIPFMTSVVKESFELVPPLLKEAGYSMGGTKWEVIKDVVIPYAIGGIFGGMVLSLGRALGETMAVSFVAGNVHAVPKSLLEPLTTITVSIANEFTEAHSELYLSSLFYLALLLFIFSFILLIIAKFLIIQRIGKKWQVKNI